MTQIPADFDSRGLLPAGVYAATLSELRASLLVEGPPNRSAAWDSRWRLHLVDQLESLVGDLWSVGIDRVFIDGSFVTEKPHPGDIDGYFVTSFPSYVVQSTKLRNRRPAWDLSLRKPDAQGKLKPLMWHDHRIEVFPVFDPPFRHYSARGTASTYIDRFFQQTRASEPKGVVQILKEATP